MSRFHVFKRDAYEKRKVTTVEAANYGEAVKRVAESRNLPAGELFAQEVRERVREKCPGCSYERMVAKRRYDWQRPRRCAACEAQVRGELHAESARQFFEKARRIRAARASRG